VVGLAGTFPSSGGGWQRRGVAAQAVAAGAGNSGAGRRTIIGRAWGIREELTNLLLTLLVAACLLVTR